MLSLNTGEHNGRTESWHGANGRLLIIRRMTEFAAHVPASKAWG